MIRRRSSGQKCTGRRSSHVDKLFHTLSPLHTPERAKTNPVSFDSVAPLLYLFFFFFLLHPLSSSSSSLRISFLCLPFCPKASDSPIKQPELWSTFPSSSSSFHSPQQVYEMF
ncbi:hypothetical protein CEXT_31141 [Caerostris extrusa]|uniref:Uncharacterized protein n=1 Tax=Caerostris extrusa TaxID=172846 RepID=A0AAV4XJY6_CAEEX|nr:hypothetical protein CEXT_31141 [Caerostris extrusa]